MRKSLPIEGSQLRRECKMSTTSEIKNKLSAKAKQGIKPSPYKTIQDLLKRMQPEIQKALPKHMDADRIARIALTEMRKNPKLLQASQASLLGAIMTAAQLGLEPGVLGHAYLIPYYNRKTNSTEVQFQIGYKGLLDLVRRSGEIQNIDVHEVCDNDEFEYEYGLEPKLRHKPALKDRGKAYAYYAVAKFKDGQYSFLVMSKEDVEKIRSRSKSPNSGPWVTDYDAMAKKTVIKQLCKYLPMSIEVQKAIAADETTKQEIREDMVEEVPDETDWIDTDYQEIPSDESEEEVSPSESVTHIKQLYKKLEEYDENKKKEITEMIKAKYSVKSLALLSEEQTKEILTSLS